MALSNKEIIDLLEKHWPNIGKNEIASFIENSEYAFFESKEIILDNLTKKKQAFFILTGSVRGYIIDDEGEERNLILRSEGVFTGDANMLFGDQPKTIHFETITPTDVLIINFEDFEKMVWKNPNIMKLYINALKDAVMVLTYRVHTMISLSHEERYLDLLRKNPTFLKDSFNKHIANYLGITPVSLSRIIARVKNKKE
ncbi:MAG: Crp/Fnr family transcriptional regulator [Lutimonas sp.]